jgi:hypothetical protein
MLLDFHEKHLFGQDFQRLDFVHPLSTSEDILCILFTGVQNHDPGNYHQNCKRWPCEFQKEDQTWSSNPFPVLTLNKIKKMRSMGPGFQV